MPTTKGKPAITNTFIDKKLIHDEVKGSNCTENIHFMNKTPIQ